MLKKSTIEENQNSKNYLTFQSYVQNYRAITLICTILGFVGLQRLLIEQYDVAYFQLTFSFWGLLTGLTILIMVVTPIYEYVFFLCYFAAGLVVLFTSFCVIGLCLFPFWILCGFWSLLPLLFWCFIPISPFLWTFGVILGIYDFINAEKIVAKKYEVNLEDLRKSYELENREKIDDGREFQELKEFQREKLIDENIIP